MPVNLIVDEATLDTLAESHFSDKDDTLLEPLVVDEGRLRIEVFSANLRFAKEEAFLPNELLLCFEEVKIVA